MSIRHSASVRRCTIRFRVKLTDHLHAETDAKRDVPHTIHTSRWVQGGGTALVEGVWGKSKLPQQQAWLPTPNLIPISVPTLLLDMVHRCADAPYG
ncbi:hypothetical protein C8255_13410 [filamentous cyanobacterium CCP3]|nr:hypothetical protein C8255_13410 [filamentous cyanobacterium CCP3]